VPSQQPQGQLQTQHSVDTSNYIMGNLTAQRPITKLTGVHRGHINNYQTKYKIRQSGQ
jgi:hypothetical protein